jgi:hypothetical protein
MLALPINLLSGVLNFLCILKKKCEKKVKAALFNAKKKSHLCHPPTI